ncbi:V-type ATP synthase subunit E family protein [Cyanobium usitatum]|uniref:hypothetical protein n=1 Tax=Cyanobium usitatum TaxID=2304190 RepID=UPI002AD2465F|nr:hypothetical protein [Cyanobium usitatum]
MTITTAPTKAEELAALRELASRLGPDSYLGPWLLDCLGYLAAEITADIRPTSPAEMYRQASEWRINAEAASRLMRAEARQALDNANATADQVLAKAQAEAEEIRERLASAIRSAQREVWA